ncbi:DM9 domain-containing protein [Fasciola gigantica]|uniref:DM9 domain-containing protein n=1 Tax=Fasciola gigantica TaxID=46835 RepID=A0A504YBL5_FASGI|nr:DM9 domain-containing protein [Fasciola gigantica]
MYRHQQPAREASLSWLPVYPHTQPPPNAVAAQPGLYVIRGRENVDVLPGKWLAQVGSGFIPFDGREKPVSSFEVLCNTSLYQDSMPYTWIPSGGGNVPHDAVQGGITESMEPLYIARGMVNNEWCVGKVHPSHGCAYFPWGGEEHSLQQYEVLCYTN